MPVWSWEDRRLIMLPVPKPGEQRIIVRGGGGGGSGGGGGGVTDHAMLTNLDYAGSGHTGFEASGTAASTIAAHLADPNPHPQYLFVSDYNPITDHGALSGLGDNDHPQYLLAASYTAADVLAKLLTVDGAGSGLDADLLDGQSSAYYFPTASFVPPGSTTQVLYNAAGAWGADAGLTYDAVNDALTVAGRVITPLIRPASDSTTAVRVQNAAGANDVIVVDTTNRRLGVGVTPVAPFHMIGALGEMRIATSATDATQKSARLTISHYTNAEEPLAGFIATSDSVDNTVLYGGGSGLANAATQMIFYTAANNTTTTGTAVMYIRVTGVFFGGTTPATAWVDMAASTTARASSRTRAGVRPTTPNAGDSWDDGATVFYQVNGTSGSVVNSLKLERGSTNTPGTGFGLAILAQLESSTTETRDAGRLIWKWDVSTDASRASIVQATAYYTSTERPCITWGANSSVALLSFYDVTTPIARQVLATGVSATVDDVITALQALGLVKQS